MDQDPREEEILVASGDQLGDDQIMGVEALGLAGLGVAAVVGHEWW